MHHWVFKSILYSQLNAKQSVAIRRSSDKDSCTVRINVSVSRWPVFLVNQHQNVLWSSVASFPLVKIVSQHKLSLHASITLLLFSFPSLFQLDICCRKPIFQITRRQSKVTGRL